MEYVSLTCIRCSPFYLMSHFLGLSSSTVMPNDALPDGKKKKISRPTAGCKTSNKATSDSDSRCALSLVSCSKSLKLEDYDKI